MVGLVIGIARFAWDSAYPAATCGEQDARPGVVGDVHYLHFGIVLFAVVVGVTVVISLLTQPIDDKHASCSLRSCLLLSWLSRVSLSVRPSVCLFLSLCLCLFCLQCFDAVGWAAGRASGL